MNKEQFLSLVRTLIQVGSGILIAKGIGDAGLWEIVGGAALSLAGYGWSFVTHQK